MATHTPHRPALWLYLCFHQLPVDMYQRALATPQPIAVLSAPPAPQVLWANMLAEEKGIQPGMALHTALCLAADLHYTSYEETRVCEQLKHLAQWAYAYSATIALYPPDGLLLEVGSMTRLFRGLNPLVSQMQADLEHLGFSVHLATGHTPLAARILACAAMECLSEDPEQIARQLLSVELSQCFLPEGQAALLNRMGIHQLKQLQAIPVAELGQRFGKALCDHLDRLSGALAAPQTLYQPPEHFERTLSFMHEIEHTTGLLFPIKRQLGELALFLQMRAQATDHIALTLQHRDGTQTHLLVRSAVAQTQPDELLKLTTLKLDTLVLPAPVTGLSFRVDHLQAYQPDARDLFDTPQHQEDATQLINRLTARLGTTAVYQSNWQADHRPEQAGTLHPVYQLSRMAARLASAYQPPTAIAPLRPTWLCPAPYPIHNTPVTILSGPERINSGWWSENKVTRDYYIARFTHGGVGWIFQDTTGDWFLHGWFG